MKTHLDLRKYAKKCQTSTMLFTWLKKMYSTSVEKRNTIQLKELRSLMYSDIDSFPLLKFMDCLCDNKMISLYKDSNQVPLMGIRNEKLEFTVFHELYFQFLDRFFGNDQSIFENKKKLMMTYSKICILETIEQSYYSLKSKNIVIKTLRKFGVRLSDNNESNITIISGVKNSQIRKYNDILIKIGENVEEDEDEKNGWSRQTFIDLTSSLSQFFERQISISILTVGEFCSLYQLMKKQANKTPKHNQNGKRSYR